jgi:hypothetical protein
LWIGFGLAAAIQNTYLPVVFNPGSTSTPTPTTEPQTVQILDNFTSYTDPEDGWLYIFGEVENKTADIIHNIEIYVGLFNNSALVDTDFVYTWLKNLPPGEKSCFSILIADPPTWTTFEFVTLYYETGGSPLPNIAISDVYRNDTEWWVEIGGIATNNESVKVSNVTPVTTAYNSAGQVIECVSTYVDSTDLDPGVSSTFENLLVGQNPADINSYRIQVGGDIE